MVSKKEKEHGSYTLLGRNRLYTCYMYYDSDKCLKKKIEGNVKVKAGGGSLDKAIREGLFKNMTFELRP